MIEVWQAAHRENAASVLPDKQSGGAGGAGGAAASNNVVLSRAQLMVLILTLGRTRHVLAPPMNGGDCPRLGEISGRALDETFVLFPRSATGRIIIL